MRISVELELARLSRALTIKRLQMSAEGTGDQTHATDQLPKEPETADSFVSVIASVSRISVLWHALLSNEIADEEFNREVIDTSCKPSILVRNRGCKFEIDLWSAADAAFFVAGE